MKVEKNKLTFISKEGKYSFYLFKPTYTNLFYNNIYPYKKSITQYIRFFLELNNEYKVYYMFEGCTLLGFCVVHLCGGRYRFISSNSVMIGPYVVLKEYRGNGLGKIMLSTIVNKVLNYQCLYAYIHNDNIPSINTCEFIGMNAISGLKINHYTHRISLADIDNSEFKLYKMEISNGK